MRVRPGKLLILLLFSCLAFSCKKDKDPVLTPQDGISSFKAYVDFQAVSVRNTEGKSLYVRCADRIVKLDRNGGILWQIKRLEDSFTGEYVKDGEMIVINDLKFSLVRDMVDVLASENEDLIYGCLLAAYQEKSDTINGVNTVLFSRKYLIYTNMRAENGSPLWEAKFLLSDVIDNVYDDQERSKVTFSGLLAANDLIYCFGSYLGTDGLSRYYAFASDKTGSLLWKREYFFPFPAEEGIINYVDMDEEGKIMVIGKNNNSVFACRMEKDGSVLWKNNYRIGDCRPKCHEYSGTSFFNDNGEFVITGYGAPGEDNLIKYNYYLTRIDKYGVQKWDTIYGTDLQDFSTSSLLNMNGGYTLIGTSSRQTSPGVDFRSNIYLIETDRDGKRLYEKNIGEDYGFHAVYFHQNNDRSYTILGSKIGFGDPEAIHTFLITVPSPGSASL